MAGSWSAVKSPTNQEVSRRKVPMGAKSNFVSPVCVQYFTLLHRSVEQIRGKLPSLFQFSYFDPHIPKSRWSPIPPTKVITEDKMKMKGLGQIGRLSGRHHQDRRESPLQEFWRQFLNSQCRLLWRKTLPVIISCFRLRVFPILFAATSEIDLVVTMTQLTRSYQWQW